MALFCNRFRLRRVGKDTRRMEPIKDHSISFIICLSGLSSFSFDELFHKIKIYSIIKKKDSTLLNDYLNFTFSVHFERIYIIVLGYLFSYGYQFGYESIIENYKVNYFPLNIITLRHYIILL